MNCIPELNYKFCCIIMVHKSFASSSYEVSISLDEADQNNHANFEQEYHKMKLLATKSDCGKMLRIEQVFFE